MQATTVEVQERVGETTFLNCGFILETAGATTIQIGGHCLMLNEILEAPVAAAQRFADLLTDVTE